MQNNNNQKQKQPRDDADPTPNDKEAADPENTATGTSATVKVIETRKGMLAPRHFVAVGENLSAQSSIFLRVSTLNYRGTSEPRLGTFSVATKQQIQSISFYQ